MIAAMNIANSYAREHIQDMHAAVQQAEMAMRDFAKSLEPLAQIFQRTEILRLQLKRKGRPGWKRMDWRAMRVRNSA